MKNIKGIEEDIVKSAFSAMEKVDVSIRTAEEIAMIIGGIAIGITCVAEHLEVKKEILPRIVNGLQDLYVPKEKRIYWKK